ncbi:MAG TPA: HDOD domain-containing protein [Sideroxyarcus sp.]|nr:HDOD domain-containing protein [Sideroxyarcus sp.]
MTDISSITPQNADPLLERVLLKVEIPPCPDILNRIMDELSKDEPDHNRLISIISADVALAAGLIKTTNSPYFARQQRARSVHDALTILGLKVASHTIAAIILRKAFPNTANLIRFWDASARTARLCAWLAHKLDIHGLIPEDAYTYGLFHDCGIPVLLERFPNYKQVLSQANRDLEKPFTDMEDAGIHTNHAVVGSALAKSWWLPEDMYLGILHHHDLKALTPDSPLPELPRLLIATAQFAEHISQQQLGLDMTQEWPKLGEGCLQILQIDAEDLDFLYAEAKQVVEATE